MKEDKKGLPRMLLRSLKDVSVYAQLCLLTATLVWVVFLESLCARRFALGAPLRLRFSTTLAFAMIQAFSLCLYGTILGISLKL